VHRDRAAFARIHAHEGAERQALGSGRHCPNGPELLAKLSWQNSIAGLHVPPSAHAKAPPVASAADAGARMPSTTDVSLSGVPPSIEVVGTPLQARAATTDPAQTARDANVARLSMGAPPAFRAWSTSQRFGRNYRAGHGVSHRDFPRSSRCTSRDQTSTRGRREASGREREASAQTGPSRSPMRAGRSPLRVAPTGPHSIMAIEDPRTVSRVTAGTRRYSRRLARWSRGALVVLHDPGLHPPS
jgi:hypothetical protein